MRTNHCRDWRGLQLCRRDIRQTGLPPNRAPTRLPESPACRANSAASNRLELPVRMIKTCMCGSYLSARASDNPFALTGRVRRTTLAPKFPWRLKIHNVSKRTAMVIGCLRAHIGFWMRSVAKNVSGRFAQRIETAGHCYQQERSVLLRSAQLRAVTRSNCHAARDGVSASLDAPRKLVASKASSNATVRPKRAPLNSLSLSLRWPAWGSSRNARIAAANAPPKRRTWRVSESMLKVP